MVRAQMAPTDRLYGDERGSRFLTTSDGEHIHFDGSTATRFGLLTWAVDGPRHASSLREQGS
ncbi:hypothetical protein GCM10010394_17410 [Streptomyces crystallinus]|uniref:Uncharacterized protein n=2 Tax=Streptomyces crystallinus TaxID=68191 RepID=A0ABP3QD50_9ACTN